QDVAVGLGYPGVEGGNALMVVDVANGAQHVVRELLPSVAPSGFDVVVGTFTPPPRAAGPPPAPNPCALNLGVALPPPPAPPACAGACHGCTQTGPPVEILIGAAPCDGKAGWSRYVALPSFVDRFTYWSPDGNAWEFFSKSDTTNTQGTDDAGGCASWGALTQTTVTYWDGSVTTTGGS
ncbi:MAG TPA: hypothetical protein VKG44_00915, partial [Candidatus Baltobacteraceae bacterium]|nr:hypothetical protein [Candidatus Baltobacteraceae bacterium]